MAIITTIKQLRGTLSRREIVISLLLVPMMLLTGLLEIVGLGVLPLYVTLALSREDSAYLQGDGALGWLQSYESGAIVVVGGVIIAFLFLLKNAYSLVVSYAVARFAAGRQFSVGRRLFRAYHRAPFEELLQINTSEIIRNISSEAVIVGNSVLALGNLVISMFTGLSIIILLAFDDVFAMAFTCIIATSVFAIYSLLLNPKLREAGKKVLEAKQNTIGGLTQAFESLRESRVMGFASLLERKVQKAMQVHARMGRKQKILEALASPLMEVLSVAAVIVLIVVITTSQAKESDALSSITLFIIGIARLRSCTTKAVGCLGQLNYYSSSLNEIYSRISYLEGLSKEIEMGSDSASYSLTNSIRLYDVSYTYPKAAEASLNNVSMDIGKGEVVGICGTTGSGKTTLVNVLLGLLEPTSGGVLFDGKPLGKQQRPRVGYVPQYIYLLDGSLRDNIMVTKTDRSSSERDIWRALSQAQLADFVRQHPQGLDIHVGENGVNLSGGQRQRIGIARALLHRPEVLVFDEATSALDVQTEDSLMKSIHNLRGKVTVLLVAHRLSTLEGCDRIITMEGGTILSNERVQTSKV